MTETPTNVSSIVNSDAHVSDVMSLTPRHLKYDVIVIGAGVAGLAFTLSLPSELRVALLTKGVLGESNTRYAQGGLSAAVGPDDNPALHAADTLIAGAGLSDPEAVARLVEGAPNAVRWLTALGAHFDQGSDGQLLLGREAAHSRRRVLHAGGDATGAEIERALVARVREDPNVDLFPGAFVIDLLVQHGQCRGIVAELESGGPLTVFQAPVTALAAGGAGQLWATTSNPSGATADGLAMALRAGAAIADTEFVQFHPTVLALPGEIPFLVSEAVRGEGAYLRDVAGERFMIPIHPLAELAPRDVVARAIQRQMALDGRDHVDLDLRHLDPAETRARFPTITRELAQHELDLATDLIPIAPAAHYFIGGVVASPEGITSLPGLLAFGEAAVTGIHGANRLASNSLLEGLVFGMAGADRLAREWPHPLTESHEDPASVPAPVGTTLELDEITDLRMRLQLAMSRHVSVVRDAAGLAQAHDDVETIAGILREHSTTDLTSLETRRPYWELRNLVDGARSVIDAAAHREESRGAHFRADFPETNPARDGQHSLREADGTFRDGALEEAYAVKVP